MGRHQCPKEGEGKGYDLKAATSSIGSVNLRLWSGAKSADSSGFDVKEVCSGAAGDKPVRF